MAKFNSDWTLSFQQVFSSSVIKRRSQHMLEVNSFLGASITQTNSCLVKSTGAEEIPGAPVRF